MNAQEIFDKVVAHLAKQGHRAVGTGGGCMYLAPNGDMCAVGCLLGDTYDPKMEGAGVEALVSKYKWPFGQHVKLLYELQRAHDAALTLNQLQGFLAETAANFNLNFDRAAITNWH